jgi:SagB-type dehydrogenase family enzyme
MPGESATAKQRPRLPRFKRAVTLVLYWYKGELVCENYRTRSRAGINSLGIELLDYFREWRTRQDCFDRFSEYSRVSVLRVINEMVRRSLLLRERSPQAEADATCERAWARWLPHAGFLHFGTKDVKYAESEAEIDSILAEVERAGPQPPFSKVHAGAVSMELHEPAGVDARFLDVLLKRRTHRSFSKKALSIDHLSALLYYTWGVTGYMDVPVLGRLPLKTSPSAGARHPGEVYVAALRVAGLKPGLYHYVSDGHRLEFIANGAHPNRAIEYCAGQQWVGDATALFIMTAVFARTMWKYDLPRAYRVVLADAGHLCQTFCLVACALGLAPFCTMALKDSLIESDLGLNGFDESVLYVAAVGAPPSPDSASAP